MVLESKRGTQRLLTINIRRGPQLSPLPLLASQLNEQLPFSHFANPPPVLRLECTALSVICRAFHGLTLTELANRSQSEQQIAWRLVRRVQIESSGDQAEVMLDVSRRGGVQGPIFQRRRPDETNGKKKIHTRDKDRTAVIQ